MHSIVYSDTVHSVQFRMSTPKTLDTPRGNMTNALVRWQLKLFIRDPIYVWYNSEHKFTVLNVHFTLHARVLLRIINSLSSQNRLEQHYWADTVWKTLNSCDSLYWTVIDMNGTVFWHWNDFRSRRVVTRAPHLQQSYFELLQEPTKMTNVFTLLTQPT